MSDVNGFSKSIGETPAMYLTGFRGKKQCGFLSETRITMSKVIVIETFAPKVICEDPKDKLNLMTRTQSTLCRTEKVLHLRRSKNNQRHNHFVFPCSMSHYGLSLLHPPLADKPARRLWDEPA